ncbi:squalene--hopene cyclase [Azospirillum formosense]|uniref:Squalene--hopene cyclase n=1 Tax=Azospirillum formosense TaxID=861533 RepID=A0ABX2KS31_9PROT|nr:squalene--hopene cyclase [Azospirillum formosense]NUB19434.1 squalene--hopene cyclase [Azospirillum formosense]
MNDHNASTTLRVQRAGTSAKAVGDAVAEATDALIRRQQADGHWVFELEADATIPSEYLLLHHILDEIDPELEAGLAAFIRGRQGKDGGWPLFFGGAMDISCSVKAYFALKAAGDSPDAPHMRRAREAILARGGAARCNVFTRILLAQFGQIPWRAVPAMPVEVMNLPPWSPFHISRISYWSRTVVVPLLVVMAHRLRARNPRGIGIAELFTEPPEEVRNWHSNTSRGGWATLFRALDAALHAVEPRLPANGRQTAIDRAVRFVTERLNGEDGLGAIFPAMVNAVLMFHCLGLPPDHPDAATARRALRGLMVRQPGRVYCQPCLSPVWDTAIICNALLETGSPRARAAARRGADWLIDRQILDVAGDWAWQRPGLASGGWAFQYNNAHYPDTDDTAMVVMALQRLDADRYEEPIRRARDWIVGMQSRNGGWGAFDAENQHDFLNHIPFADHGALLDPPTSDVTARCVMMLARLGEGRDTVPTRRGLTFLEREQESDGSWFGRWGTNYVYGTWSALEALNAAGVPHAAPAVQRAAQWLLAHQRADGGWGEDGASYWPGNPRGEGPVSTASQTAWALLGLMAAGKGNHPAVDRGVDYLLSARDAEGLWSEEPFTAVGFPRVFYLKYHGYAASFPLWALARYRALRA